MENDNWQKKTIVFSFIAIESLLLLISMIKPAFSSYAVFSRQNKIHSRQLQLKDRFKASDRYFHRKLALAEAKLFHKNTLPYSTSTPDVTSVVNNEQVDWQQDLDNFLAKRNKIVSLYANGTGITQISTTALWEIDSLIIILILALILFRVNQQIQHKSQFYQEAQDIDLPEAQSSDN